MVYVLFLLNWPPFAKELCVRVCGVCVRPSEYAVASNFKMAFAKEIRVLVSVSGKSALQKCQVKASAHKNVT